jgi:hypothetical protein
MSLGPTARRLLDHLLPAADDPLADDLARWLSDARFRAFAEAHRDKIRKKLRSTTDADGRLDVRAELAVAAALTRDKAIALAFEAYGATAGGPDFTVSVRGGVFNLEVTRLHRDPASVTDGGPIVAKLRQLPPSVPNVVLVAVAGPDAAAFDAEGGIRALRGRAEAHDEVFFQHRGLDGQRAFRERVRRLGATIAWAENGAGDERVAVWINRDARIPVPERALRACVAALAATPSGPSGS